MRTPSATSGLPSLYHVISGGGRARLIQGRMIGPPSLMVVGGRGPSITGGTADTKHPIIFQGRKTLTQCLTQTTKEQKAATMGWRPTCAFSSKGEGKKNGTIHMHCVYDCAITSSLIIAKRKRKKDTKSSGLVQVMPRSKVPKLMHSALILAQNQTKPVI